MFVIKYTQFPIITDLDSDYYNLSNYFNYVPVPFAFIESYRAIILNTILTIPFGFMIPYVIKVNFKKIIVFGLLFSIILEMLQLSVHLILGAHNRVVDINDVIFNLVGGIIGYIMFRLFLLLYRYFIETFNIEMNSFLKYIYYIAINNQTNNKKSNKSVV